MRRSSLSVDGISLPAVFAFGTSDVIVFSGIAVHGAGAEVYVIAGAVFDGADDDEDGADPEEDLVPVWPACCPAAWCSVEGAANGPDVSAQPAQAMTRTGLSRAVSASGKGRSRTAYFSCGDGQGPGPCPDTARRPRAADGTTVSHEYPCCERADSSTTGAVPG
ncbi:hypothetical protein GCM10010512_28830 [Streptomyces thermoviolaceus subsp. thermoviolaceus]|nr:hypothetical protein GCM10010499_50520 [Streptomyces thermoviolaceus subsp. apingens]GHA95550.1 hypothetical protein GCM10010512_28830 [Streptomyces thermoviolaceus subsp. thermoviolaceus]